MYAPKLVAESTGYDRCLYKTFGTRCTGVRLPLAPITHFLRSELCSTVLYGNNRSLGTGYAPVDVMHRLCAAPIIRLNSTGSRRESEYVMRLKIKPI